MNYRFLESFTTWAEAGGPCPEDRATMVPRIDTSRHVAQLQIERWRRMSPLEKLRLVSDLTIATRELCRAGIRLRHPGATGREIRLHMALITLERDLAIKAYPEAAALDA